MSIREPLVIITGIVQNLPSGDILKPTPESLTFEYTTGSLTKVTSASGTKTLVYATGKLSTVTDTISGKLSTFGYTSGKLTSITVTSL